MHPRERRALEERWRVERRRSVPSESVVFWYLERFHDAGEEARRESHRAFIPAPNEALKGLGKVNADYAETGGRRYFRADAAFAKPDIYEYLEERRVFYAIRLPSNKVLQWEIAPLLIRPVGRPPKRPVILYDDFWYRAGSWDRARRVVAKVEWRRGELFPRVGFIVTNMTAVPEGVVRFYNGRGTAEQWIKEGKKYALNWTRLSCHRFVANRVRLSLFVLAYSLGNFLRRLCLPRAVKHWSLRSVQVKLIKMGGRLVRHARRLIFQLSEVSVPRRLFQGVLDRIGRLSLAPS